MLFKSFENNRTVNYNCNATQIFSSYSSGNNCDNSKFICNYCFSCNGGNGNCSYNDKNKGNSSLNEIYILNCNGNYKGNDYNSDGDENNGSNNGYGTGV